MAFFMRTCLALLLHRITYAADVSLSFDIPPIFGANQYLAYNGETVYMVCRLPSMEAKPPTILKGDSFDALVIVEDGLLRESITRKYSLQVEDLSYIVEISNLNTDDSDFYACASEVTTFWFIREVLVDVVHLFVDDQPTQLLEPTCLLDSITEGIFFIGDNVRIICIIPHHGSILGDNGREDEFLLQLITKEASATSVAYHEDSIFQSDDTPNVHYHKRIYEIRDINLEQDDSYLVCSYNGEATGSKYCDELPRIHVYEKLSVFLTPEVKTIISGDSVMFTCSSIPDMFANVDWTLSDNGDYTVASSWTWQTTDGAMLAVNGIQFASDKGGVMTVSCNVTIGTNSVTQQAVCYQGNEHEGMFTTEQDQNSESAASSRDGGITLLIVPVMIGAFIVLTIVVAITVFLKCRRKSEIVTNKDIGTSNELCTVENDCINSSSKEVDTIKKEVNLVHTTTSQDDTEYTYIETERKNHGDAISNYNESRDKGELTDSKKETHTAAHIIQNEGTQGSPPANALELGLSRENSEATVNVIYEPYDD